MKVRFRLNESRKLSLLERTYTVGNKQYWKRSDKYYSWSETDGRKEVSQDEYFKALSGGKDAPPKVKREPPKITSYKDASDEDLALSAANGDSRATDTIIRRYEPMVHKLANKYFLRGGDRDDLVQNGLIGLWDGIKSYDPDKNNNFSKFIAMAIDNRLKYTIGTESLGKNDINLSATSIDDTIGGDEDGRTYGDTISSRDLSPEEKYMGKEGAQRLIHFMKTELAEKERDVIFRFINGSTIPEISQDMGVSYKTVENALMRARNKIKEFKSKNESKITKLGLSIDEMKLISRVINRLFESNHIDHTEELDEKTYTVGDKQYWRRSGKCYRWTSTDGRKECSEDEYMKAISGGSGNAPKNTEPSEDKARNKSVANPTPIKNTSPRTPIEQRRNQFNRDSESDRIKYQGVSNFDHTTWYVDDYEATISKIDDENGRESYYLQNEDFDMTFDSKNDLIKYLRSNNGQFQGYDSDNDY